MKRKLDMMTILGLLLCVIVMVVGIILNQDKEAGTFSIAWINMENFFDLPSIFITFGGTITVLMIMFPASQLAKIPKHLKIVFAPPQYRPERYISTLVECSEKARINGLLALEEDVEGMTDEFMKSGMMMVVDSVDPEKVKEQMESWLDDLDERHTQDRSVYDKGAAIGPAFGMIGTLIGLINMLKTLSDVESVGPNMAVALVTTFYGSLLANVIFSPISNKLKERHDEEYLCMRIVCEGVQAIQAGENPKMVEERLMRLLPQYKRKKLQGRIASGVEEERSEGGGKRVA